ncbi:MAG: hypothetical protein ACK56G_06395, partial [Pirellulaceae bacterium]
TENTDVQAIKQADKPLNEKRTLDCEIRTISFNPLEKRRFFCHVTSIARTGRFRAPSQNAGVTDQVVHRESNSTATHP